MEIINLDNSDYHIHSSTFSDWMSTVDEIVKFAWEMWMTEIAITDHSRVSIDSLSNRFKFYPSWARYSLERWENMFNNVKVIFWVEWDLLDEEWNCCFDIQSYEPEFIILAAHSDVYKWDPNKITEATIKAIDKYHKKIKFIAHPCNNNDFWNYYDIDKLILIANKYNIPIEINAKNLYRWTTNLEKLDIVLKKAKSVYINSDAHNLFELKNVRQEAIKYLKEKKYI